MGRTLKKKVAYSLLSASAVFGLAIWASQNISQDKPEQTSERSHQSSSTKTHPRKSIDEHVSQQTAPYNAIQENLKNGLETLQKGSTPRGYLDAYKHFNEVINLSKIFTPELKNIHTSWAHQVHANMWAAHTLKVAGNNITPDLKLGNMDRSNNLEYALDHYANAKTLRIRLDNRNDPVPEVKTPLGYQKVATTQLIEKRIEGTCLELFFLSGYKINNPHYRKHCSR